MPDAYLYKKDNSMTRLSTYLALFDIDHEALRKELINRTDEETAGGRPNVASKQDLTPIGLEVLARAGQRIRLYVPFGQDWWPHAVRHIGEHLRNAWLLAQSMVAA